MPLNTLTGRQLCLVTNFHIFIHNTIQFIFLELFQPILTLSDSMVRIVKNELGGSATQQERRGWGVGGGGGWRVTMERIGELGGGGLNPQPPVNLNAVWLTRFSPFSSGSSLHSVHTTKLTNILIPSFCPHLTFSSLHSVPTTNMYLCS